MHLKVRKLFISMRYISHMLGEEEKKDEILQISNPTNVKHVAHIGYKPSVARAPSWMEEFKQENGESKQTNGGIEARSDTLVAFAHPIEGNSSTEESVESSSPQVIKTKAKLHTKQPGSKRRKDGGAPIRRKANASITQLSDEESVKPKRTRRRRKHAIKKSAVADDGSLSSSATSSNPSSTSSTDESGNLDRSKCESIYGSAYGATDNEGSSESCVTVACVFEEAICRKIR